MSKTYFNEAMTKTQYSINPFFLSYHGNGGGRDTYIANDNGGLYSKYEPGFNARGGPLRSRSQHGSFFNNAGLRHKTPVY